MFVGHYGVAYAAKAGKRGIPLSILFIAVQLIDVFWAVFVLFGIEKARIVRGFTATNPLDLYYMPYTHSLVGAVLWSVGAGVLYFLFRRPGGQEGVILTAAVFSHWILDWLVHRPDLPLYGNSHKVGLALWNYPQFAFFLELAILFGGIYLYLKTAIGLSPVGRYGTVVFGFLMLVVQGIVFFGPAPKSDKSAAITALVLYIVFAGVAELLERLPRCPEI